MRKKLLSLILLLATVTSLAIPAAAVSVSAESAIVLEATTGCVVYEKDADTRRPMASTTKIMTALVALESGDTTRTVSVAGDAVGVEGSSVYLETGDTLSLDDLVWALMLESANDAAAAIAIAVAGSVDAFADMMNAKAAELGLENTHFTNPHGLHNDDHYTTARDLARLAAYALQNPRFREIVSTYRHNITFGDETRCLLNHNKMLKLYDGAIGVKTGYTKRSGRCLVSAAERDGVMLVAVTLNAPDDWNDHREMLDAGFGALETRELIRAGESVFIMPCIGSEKQDVTIRNRDGLTVCVPTGTAEITRRTELPHYFWAPLNEGDVVGRIVFECEGKVIGEVPLYVDETVERIEYKQGLLERIFG
ncbi:MAG: D-alanyl-D-alanine carboxypeptidase [Clostridiales bacterium]|nr:D-alanyl-D-alanine carboxypeptidase [Clostridiales bacterium]